MTRKSIKSSLLATLAVATCFALTAAASAQDAFDLHSADLVILQSKVIQTAIGLNTAQRDKMNSFAGQYNTQVQGLLKAKDKSAQGKLQTYQMQLRNNVFGQLKPAQLKRLREISLQHDGVIALQDQVVADKVGISGAQLKKIRTIISADQHVILQYRAKAQNPIMDKYQKLKPKNKDEAKKLYGKFQEEMKVATAKVMPAIRNTAEKDKTNILAVLSPKQRATWTALLGPIFKG